jgi:hypothetical protein
MATTFTYNRPDERLSTSATGSVDSTYSANWLVDGKTSYPARYTASGVAWTVNGSSQEVGIVVVGHHLLDAGLGVAITGGVTTTVTIPTYGKNGIPFNGYSSITPVSGVTQVIATVTGNTGSAVIIGELVAGKRRTLPGTLSPHTGFLRNNFTKDRPIDRAWIPPYDRGMVAEQWEGTLLLTSSQRADLLAWEESQKSRTLPSVVVITRSDLGLDLALFGFVEVGRQIPVGQLWKIDIRFVELPRTRW